MQTAHDPEDRCRWKLRVLRPLYQRGLSAEEVRKLFRVSDWMRQLPLERGLLTGKIQMLQRIVLEAVESDEAALLAQTTEQLAEKLTVLVGV